MVAIKLFSTFSATSLISNFVIKLMKYLEINKISAIVQFDNKQETTTVPCHHYQEKYVTKFGARVTTICDLTATDFGSFCCL